MDDKAIIKSPSPYSQLNEGLGIQNILTDSHRCEYLYSYGTFPHTEMNANYWLSERGYTGFVFVMDLGCLVTVKKILVKQGHNAHAGNQ